MKIKILKIAALCVAVALIISVLLFANSLLGNPISHILARSAAEKYITERYPDEGYAVDRTGFDFKFGRYYAYVSSERVKDGEFTIYASMLGEILGDDYELRVTERENVYWRINDDYRTAVNSVFDGWTSPYNVDLYYGMIEVVREEYTSEYGIGIKKSELELGGIYNVSLLGEEAGVVVMYVDSDEVSNEYAAEILLDFKRAMDSAGVGFCKLDLTLRYPPSDPEIPYERPEGEIWLHGFAASDIYEDGILERIKTVREKTEEYCNSQLGDK